MVQLAPNSNWAVKESPNEQDVQLLRKQLEAYNIAQAHIDEGVQLAIFLRDTQNNIAAGITGWLWGACLEIDFLWVHEDLRGRGIGERLVRSLEGEAKARGCRQIVLETFSFQAPDFYQRLGYNTFGVIDGYAHGHQKVFMQKQLGSP